jgi:hypothetical protein
VITTQTYREFTKGEVLALVRKENPSISTSVVSATLRLFKARKLITQKKDADIISSNPKLPKRGRPQAKFICTFNQK